MARGLLLALLQPAGIRRDNGKHKRNDGSRQGGGRCEGPRFSGIRPALLDRPTVAKVLGIGQSTVTFLTHAEPTFPKPIKISNATRWKAAEVIAWANAIQTNSFEITGPITTSAKNTKKNKPAAGATGVHKKSHAKTGRMRRLRAPARCPYFSYRLALFF